MKTRERTYAAFEIREGTADRQEAEVLIIVWLRHYFTLSK